MTLLMLRARPIDKIVTCIWGLRRRCSNGRPGLSAVIHRRSSIQPNTAPYSPYLKKRSVAEGIMGRTEGASEISLEIRSAILTLHLFTNKSWIEISKCLLVNPASAQQICTKAKVSKKEVSKIGEYSVFDGIASTWHSEACAGLGNMID